MLVSGHAPDSLVSKNELIYFHSVSSTLQCQLVDQSSSGTFLGNTGEIEFRRKCWTDSRCWECEKRWQSSPLANLSRPTCQLVIPTRDRRQPRSSSPAVGETQRAPTATCACSTRCWQPHTLRHWGKGVGVDLWRRKEKPALWKRLF